MVLLFLNPNRSCSRHRPIQHEAHFPLPTPLWKLHQHFTSQKDINSYPMYLPILQDLPVLQVASSRLRGLGYRQRCDVEDRMLIEGFSGWLGGESGFGGFL